MWRANALFVTYEAIQLSYKQWYGLWPMCSLDFKCSWRCELYRYFLKEVNMKWAAVCEKVPYGLSRSHTKRRTGARGCARPSFGMTPTFQKKKKIRFFFFFFFFFFIRCHMGPRPPVFWYDTDSGHKGSFCMAPPISWLTFYVLCLFFMWCTNEDFTIYWTLQPSYEQW